MGTKNEKWLLNELRVAGAIWPLIYVDHANISDSCLNCTYSIPLIGRCVGRFEQLLGFWGKAPAAKRFPGYYRGLRERERWMKESRCYFSALRPKSGDTVPPLQKWGVRVHPVPPVSYAYGDW